MPNYQEKNNFYLIPKNRVKTLSIYQTFDKEIPEEYKNNQILNLLGRELAIKLIEYKKILFHENTNQGYIEVKVNLDIIVPKIKEENKC